MEKFKNFEKMSNDMAEMDTCEFCNKTCSHANILRHIGNWWNISSCLYKEQILEEPCIICNHEPNCLEKNGKTLIYEKI